MNNHTPGPWTYEAQDGVGSHCVLAQVFAPDGTAIADIVSTADGEQASANARLMAQAPALVEALEWIVDIAERNYEQDDKLRAQGARTLARIAAKARDAITKAIGATP